jgi:cytidylate kinase
MSAMTISHLIGSKGTLICKEVAKRMNYNIEVVQEIMEQYGEIGFKNLYDSKLSAWDRYSYTTKDMLDFFKRVMLSIVKSGNSVIIGRGSFVSLAQYADVLDVMIYTPMDTRIKAIMEMRGISNLKKAKDYIVKKEEIRQSFIEHTFNVKWNKVDNFDIVFNTGKLKPEFVIDSIVLACRELENNKADASMLLTSGIETDEVLDNTVRNVLKK